MNKLKHKITLPYFILILLTITKRICMSKTYDSNKTEVDISTHFPSVQDVNEFVTLSKLVYHLRSHNSCRFKDLKCHWYKYLGDGTQVMVVSSQRKKYIAVVFAGTDNWRTFLTDADIVMTPFGPKHNPLVNPKIYVHKGFNHAVFYDNLFNDILTTITSFVRQYPSFRVITSGHSLGAANSILTAVALSIYLPERRITSISFGSPRVGGKKWTSYVNNIRNLGIWRFVYEADIVPRLPIEPYKHTGHTIQIEDTNVTAYYLHVGDEYYTGVPSNWSFASSLSNHHIANYYYYIKNKTIVHPDMYYTHHFLKKTTVQYSNKTNINNGYNASVVQ